MPTLDQYTQTKLFKGIMIGNSGAGKTGSLVSLVKAGYKLRIIDLDNGLRPLVAEVRAQCPDKITSVEVMSVRDIKKPGPRGMQVVGAPKAFVQTLGLLEKWEDGTDPATWGSEYVLVIDSGTALGTAAFDWFRAINPTIADERQIYKLAQSGVDNMFERFTGPEFNTNIIFISHISYAKDGRGYTSIVGSALGPKIPRHIDILLIAEVTGSGDKVVRTIRTVPTLQIDAKNPWYRDVPAVLPLNSGLATLFEALNKTGE